MQFSPRNVCKTRVFIFEHMPHHRKCAKRFAFFLWLSSRALCVQREFAFVGKKNSFKVCRAWSSKRDLNDQKSFKVFLSQFDQSMFSANTRSYLILHFHSIDLKSKF